MGLLDFCCMEITQFIWMKGKCSCSSHWKCFWDLEVGSKLYNWSPTWSYSVVSFENKNLFVCSWWKLLEHSDFLRNFIWCFKTEPLTGFSNPWWIFLLEIQDNLHDKQWNAACVQTKWWGECTSEEHKGSMKLCCCCLINIKARRINSTWVVLILTRNYKS